MIASKDRQREQGSLARLTPRQEECLRGVLELKSVKEIARELGISPHAVEKRLRIAREKLGVGTSAEAARLFALKERGNDFAQSGLSDLASSAVREHQRLVLDRANRPSSVRLEDNNRALSLDQPLTPRQTLLTIFAVSFGSIVGLLLLVACAEGIGSLFSS